MQAGLRFDKVARAFIARLQDALSGRVPEGTTLVVTCTAPIRKDSATSAALVDVLTDALARGPARLELHKTINGNRIRARLVKRASARADKIVAFVHNPGVDVEELFSL